MLTPFVKSTGLDEMEDIPLVDLRRQHEPIASELLEAVKRVAEAGDFVLGRAVADFERAYARFVGVAECVGVGNGTDALELALRAVGLEQGQEVLVPGNSFTASAVAVIRAGGTPVFTDVDGESLLLDGAEVERRLTDGTRAVMPVHLYGQLAPTEEITDALGGREISLVEDGAQAHGATRLGRPVGYHGDAVGVSFYPGKNLGAWGDAGAVLTSSGEVAARVRRLRNLGGQQKYEHELIGFNSRLDSIQAAILSVKLARLERWNAERRRAAEVYDVMLADLEPVQLPTTLPGNVHVWHLYAVRVQDRDGVARELQAAGVGVGVHYPVPIHLQPAFAEFGYRPGDLPFAEAAAREVLSLPLYPGITEMQQERVVEELRRAVSR